MSAPDAPPPVRRAGSFVVTGLVAWVTDLAASVGGDCLVHGEDGRLLAHALVSIDVPPTVVQAVLRGATRPLERGIRDRQTVGLTSAGAVLQGRVDAVHATWVPVGSNGERIGGFWLLGAAPSLGVLESLAAELVPMLTAQMEKPELLLLLDGTLKVLPDNLAGSERLWVLAADGDVALARLARGRLAVSTCVAGPIRFAVIGGAAGTPVARRVSCLIQGQARVAVSEPVHSLAGLRSARDQALLLLDATAPGTCGTAQSLRPQIVLRHLAQALRSLPELGHDPLKALRAYDERRGSNLVATLRWSLADDGDLVTTAKRVGVHPNTLRYRMKRVEEVGGFQLRGDVARRIELQVRLLSDL